MQFWKKALVGVVAAASLGLAATGALAQSNDTKTAPVVTQQAPTTLVKSGYAPVNGIEMYYEVYGQGQPLVLVHGALTTIDMERGIIDDLAKSRQVIAVELQGHGRTRDTDRTMSFELFADDVYALMQQVGVKQADVMGYSMGGGVAEQLAIRHPESVRKLVVMSAAMRRDGWYPEIVSAITTISAAAAPYMMDTPMYQGYKAVAPNPDAFPLLLDHLGEMFRKDYDWTADVAKIKAPALVIAGDADAVRADHIVQLFATLGGTKVDHGSFQAPVSQLMIMPGTDHIQVILERNNVIVPAVSKFLDAPMPVAQ
jgi:pimeloyl-ACP methyl ester carboxylesterase